MPEDVPPNTFFIVDDIEHPDGWDLEDRPLDYIHARQVMFSIRDRKLLMKRAYE